MMKDFQEILNNRRFHWTDVSDHGLRGVIYMPGNAWDGSVIVSDDYGWDHVSVSPFRKRLVPTWEDMCFIKEQFWHKDETVIQIHPAKDVYVNNMPNCLHLWRCNYKEMVLPPSCLVGIKPGQTMDELLKEIDELEKLVKSKT